MLREQKGVKRVRATYPDAQVTIQYDPKSVTEAWLREFISELGFTAEPEPHS
jgi:copper chaperone CopZ